MHDTHLSFERIKVVVNGHVTILDYKIHQVCVSLLVVTSVLHKLTPLKLSPVKKYIS
jgi:hypothetical protein